MSKTIIAALLVVLVIGIAFFINAEQRGGLADATLKDGAFEGETEKDANNQYGLASIVIEDGRIKEVDYTEFDSDANPKGENYPYQTAIEAIPEYEKQLLETQNVEQVETVSGATTTAGKFREAANNAMQKAE